MSSLYRWGLLVLLFLVSVAIFSSYLRIGSTPLLTEGEDYIDHKNILIKIDDSIFSIATTEEDIPVWFEEQNITNDEEKLFDSSVLRLGDLTWNWRSELGVEPPSEPSLLPIPHSVQWGSKTDLLEIFSENTRVEVTIDRNPLPPRMERALTRFKAKLRIFGFYQVDPLGLVRHSLHPGYGPKGTDLRDVIPFRISYETSVDYPSFEDDESYHLVVDSHGISLEAPTTLGVLRGMSTFLQLITPDHSHGRVVVRHVTIRDKPLFQWRGILLDSARTFSPPLTVRHFMKVPDVLRSLDGMEFSKLNVLHWHLTDDQGWRLHSLTFPNLTALGSGGQFYNPQEVRQVIDYAADRGIRVVPEVDMPGHTQTLLLAFPHLTSRPPAPTSIGTKWGMQTHCLHPTSEATFRFVEPFLEELSQVFPDKYYHIGGDEVRASHFPEVDNAWKKANNIKEPHDLQLYFNQRVSKILKQLDKAMVGWQEIITENLPKETVVEIWMGNPEGYSFSSFSSHDSRAAKLGYPVISSKNFYLDMMQSAAFHYSQQPSLTWPGEAHKFLGAEGCMWAEFVDTVTLHSRLWPRSFALAERFWSPSTVVDVTDMYRRSDDMSFRLQFFGVPHLSHYLDLLRNLTEYWDALTPLTSLTDAVQVESRTCRVWSELTANRRVVQNNKEVLKRWFKEWIETHEVLHSFMTKSSALRDYSPFSQLLHEAASVGLKMVEGETVHLSSHWDSHEIKKVGLCIGEGLRNLQKSLK